MDLIGFILFFALGAFGGFLYARHKYNIKDETKSTGGSGGGAKHL